MEPNKSEIEKEGNLRHAAHGLFAKIQQKTGLEDKKIDEFQKKWLETPEVRTKYRHWWDTTAIAGEELYAMFNDIIDFMQDQESGKSHVFASLREEAEQIKKNPQAYFQHLVVIGKNWMDKGVGFAKSFGKKGEKLIPSPKIEESVVGKKVIQAEHPTSEPNLIPGEEKAIEAEKADEEWFGGEKEEKPAEEEPWGPEKTEKREEKTEKPKKAPAKKKVAPAKSGSALGGKKPAQKSK
jgi:hypothetical protein